MSLQDVIAKDVESDLLFRDFGEKMIINGVELDVDARDEADRESDVSGGTRREGVIIQVKTFYWRVLELPKPKPRQSMEIDGKKWTVTNAEEKRGLVKAQMHRKAS
ncbi:MAG: hypothetical protein ACNI27_12855 [Desulfovibrio sp.]